MQTASKNNSASTSASVLMINAQGIMLSVQGHDYFLSYNRIPWMQDAPIRSVLNVQMSGSEAIEWPDHDVTSAKQRRSYYTSFSRYAFTKSSGFLLITSG